MSIFDKFSNKPASEPAAVTTFQNSEETFVFQSLPESVQELRSLPEATLDTPFKSAALSILALCAYSADKNIGIEMLNFLKGPRPLSNQEISFLDDRFRDNKHYVIFSYFEGTSPENNYTPSMPFTLKIKSNPTSKDMGEEYMKLTVSSSGADSPRQIVLRRKGDGRWFLWEQYLLVGIRTPKSEDPWA